MKISDEDEGGDEEEAKQGNSGIKDVDMLCRGQLPDSTPKDERDEEDKKRVDLNDKVTLELTARLIIASCGLRRACMGRRWVDGKP